MRTGRHSLRGVVMALGFIGTLVSFVGLLMALAGGSILLPGPGLILSGPAVFLIGLLIIGGAVALEERLGGKQLP